MSKLPSEQMEEAEKHENLKNTIKEELVPLKDLINETKVQPIDKSNKKNHSFRLDVDLIRTLNEYSEKENITKTQLLENILNDYFNTKVLERTRWGQLVNIEIEELKGTPLERGSIIVNNYLDVWENGQYQGKDNNNTFHEGLEILEYLNKSYYLYIRFYMVLDNKRYPTFKDIETDLIDYDTAMKLAKDRKNRDLETDIYLSYKSGRQEPKKEYETLLEDSNIKDSEKIEKLKEIIEYQNSLLDLKKEDIKNGIKEYMEYYEKKDKEITERLKKEIVEYENRNKLMLKDIEILKKSQKKILEKL